MDERLGLLKGVEVLRGLGAAELRAVAGACSWRELGDGEALPTAGRLFVVREGQVLITRKEPDGRQIVLATFDAGDSFGELGLFEPEGGDTAARCEGRTRLLEFRAEPFFERRPAIAARVLNALLGVLARRIRSTNRLIAENSPWVQELRRQVLLDKLTGLHNATWLQEELPGALSAAGAGGALLMIKPDNFKAVNDTCGGHHAGDRALQLMAGLLRSLVGEGGVPVRYRGDVLAAALPGVGLRQARELAERVRRGMRDLDLSEVGPVRITVSVGVASLPRNAAPGAAAGLTEKAYANLFAARNAGGDRVRSVYRALRGAGRLGA